MSGSPLDSFGDQGSSRSLGAGRWFLYKVAMALLVAGTAYLLWGYSFGVLTNEYHATLVLKSLDPSSFQGDFLATTLDGYASPVWLVVAWFARWIPIETLFFLGYFSSRVIFAWAIGALASAWTANPRTRRIAWFLGAVSTLSMGWLLNLPVGGDGVLGPYCSHTFLSVSLLLLALSKAVRGERIWSAILMGIGFNLNIMQSILVGGCIVGFWLLPSTERLRERLRSIASAATITLLVSSPALVMAIHALLRTHGQVYWKGAELADWARFWLAGHFFLDARPPIQLASMVALLVLPMLLGLRSIHARNWIRTTPLAVSAVLALLHLYLASEHPTRLIFQLHLFRSDVFAYSTSVALAVARLASSWRRSGRHLGLDCAILTLLLMGAHIQAAIAGAVLLAIPAERTRNPGAIAWILSSFGLLGVTWSFTIGYLSPGILLGVGILYALMPQSAHSRWSAGAVFACCLLLTAHVTRRFVLETWIPFSPARIYGEDSPHSLQLREFGRSTPADAVFLLPPTRNARPFLRRGVWFNFYDGASFLWRKGAGIEATRRMDILGIKYNPSELLNLDSMYAQWNRGLCTSIPLVAAEGVTHVVLPDPQDASAPWTLHSPASALRVLGCGSSAPQSGRTDSTSL